MPDFDFEVNHAREFDAPPMMYTAIGEDIRIKAGMVYAGETNASREYWEGRLRLVVNDAYISGQAWVLDNMRRVRIHDRKYTPDFMQGPQRVSCKTATVFLYRDGRVAETLLGEGCDLSAVIALTGKSQDYILSRMKRILTSRRAADVSREDGRKFTEWRDSQAASAKALEEAEKAKVADEAATPVDDAKQN